MKENFDNNTDISVRIRQVIDYLKLTINSFALNLGYNRAQVLYDVLNGKALPSFEFFKKFEDSDYSETIDVKWLISGKGSMLKNLNTVVAFQNLKGIPLIPIDAAAGYGSGDFGSDVLNDADQYVIPDLKGRADYMIRIQGSSMVPTYSSGDVIACMKVDVNDFFQWNRAYVLDTKQGPMVKRIKKSSEAGFITLVSDNKDYDPFDIKVDSIRSIALIVALIRIL